MRIGGHGSDGLMILVPLGVAVVVGGIVFGGPANALEAANAFLVKIAREALEIVSELF